MLMTWNSFYMRCQINTMNADKTAERLFGKADFANNDYMYKTVKK